MKTVLAVLFALMFAPAAFAADACKMTRAGIVKEIEKAGMLPSDFLDISLDDFANDPDIIKALGPLPAELSGKGHRVLVKNPVGASPTVTVAFIIIDKNDCMLRIMQFPAVLVQKGLDGK